MFITCCGDMSGEGSTDSSPAPGCFTASLSLSSLYSRVLSTSPMLCLSPSNPLSFQPLCVSSESSLSSRGAEEEEAQRRAGCRCDASQSPTCARNPNRQERGRAPGVQTKGRAALVPRRLLVVALLPPRRIHMDPVDEPDAASAKPRQSAGRRPRKKRTGQRRSGKLALRGGMVVRVRRLPKSSPSSPPPCSAGDASTLCNQTKARKQPTHRKHRIWGQCRSPIHVGLIPDSLG